MNGVSLIKHHVPLQDGALPLHMKHSFCGLRWATSVTLYWAPQALQMSRFALQLGC